MEILDELALEAPKIDAYMKKVIPSTQDSKNVTDPIWELLNRGGKRFRPVMCMLSCSAVGGEPRDALHTAAIIELFHNFTLIHDDIEDGSEMRRGKPCIHKIYGMPTTINSGDGMLLYTLKAMENIRPEVRSVLYKSFLRVLNGQGMELKWNSEKKQDVREASYFQMVGMKTGALISAACEAGAMIGGGRQKQIMTLKTYGMAVGVAFQIQDDLLNLVGEETLYKKEIGGDITEGKRTLMTIHALSHTQPTEREELVSILNSNTTDKVRIQRAVSILQKSGSISYTKEKARAIVKDAKRDLDILRENEATKKLLRLADFLIEREI